MSPIGLFIFFYMCCFPTLVFAVNDAGQVLPPVAVQYRLQGGSVQIIDSIAKSSAVLPGTYRMKGWVRLKTTMKKRLRPVSFFRLTGRETSRQDVVPSAAVFTKTWPPGSSGMAGVRYKIDDNNDSLADADKLVVDYEDLYANNPTGLQLKLTFRDQRQGSALVALSDFTDESAFEVTKSVDCLKDGIEPRDNVYLARRELGLSGGSGWQYVEAAGRTVLQRRFRQILLDREAGKKLVGMDFYIRPGVDVERINFAVRVPGWPFSRRKIIEGPIISSDELVLRNGQVFIRLNMADYLLELGDYDQVILDEVTVFLKGKPGQVLSRMPIEKIDFLQAKRNVVSGSESEYMIGFCLPEVKKPGSGRKQLVLDIEALKSRARLTLMNDDRRSASEYRLEQVEVLARPKKRHSFTGIRIDRIFAANDISVPVPVIVSAMLDKIRYWGGPVFESWEQPAVNRFKWVNIQDYHVFYEYEAGRERPGRPGSIDAVVPAGGNNGILLQSDSLNIDFTWSTGVGVTKDSRFILMADPRQGAVASVLCVFTNREGKKYQVNVFLNKPVRLPAWLGDVETVTANVVFRADNRIISGKARYAIFVRNAVVFKPDTVTGKELWDAPLFFGVKRNLVPVSLETGVPAAGFSGIQGNVFAASGWRTKVDRSVDKLLRLSAVANIPRRVFEFQPCWLEFTVHGSRHSATRNLCFSSSTGNASIDLADYLRQSGFDSAEVIKDITWRATDTNADPGGDGTLRLALMENFSTLREKLRNEALLSVNGVESLPQDLSVDDGTSATIQFGEFHVAENDPRIGVSFAPRSDFEIKRIVFERDKPITVSQWQTLRTLRGADQHRVPRSGGGVSLVLKLFLALAGVVLIWAGVRYGVFTAMSTGSREVLATVIGTMLPGWRPSQGCRLVFWLGISLVLYAMGLFLRGHRGENYFFTFGGIAVVLVWRAYIFRAREWLRNNRPRLAELLYGGKGSHYFAGAIVLLVITAFFVAVKIDAAAEQVAVIVYYMLVAGVFCEFRSHFGKRNRGSFDQ